MPVVIALLGLIVTVGYFVIRARNTARVGADLLDMANDVRLAARRFGFRRQANLHPAESIEDPQIAMAAIASAFVELDDLPTADQRAALTREMARTFDVSAKDAEELSVLGRWMVAECGTPDAAISRLSRKLNRLSGADGFTRLMTLVQTAAQTGSGQLSRKQSEALDDIKRAFRIS